jgi:hypothetical protein
MKPSQYEAARQTLGWSHVEAGAFVGKSWRMMFRYAAGTHDMPPTVARLLRLLVYLRLTVSQRKFDDIVREIEKES